MTAATYDGYPTALAWYRSTVCLAERHTHGAAGEMDCLLTKFAQLKVATH